MQTAHNVQETCIVYWGPMGSGKTETLAALRRLIDPEDKARLYSVASADGSTCFFDMLPVEDFALAPLRVRMRLFAAPGGAGQEAARRALLARADALVFVADADPEAAARNRASLQELDASLDALGIDPAALPVVLQLNKRDLPGALNAATLGRHFVKRGWPLFETAATDGNLLLKAFNEAFRLNLAKLARRHGLADADPASLSVFRLLPSLTRGVAAEVRRRTPSGNGHLVITVERGDEPGLEEAVVAQIQMAEAHVQLDTTSRMLELRNRELAAVNRVSRSLLSSLDAESLLLVLLDATADYLGVSHASCVVFDAAEGGHLRTHVQGFGRDPVLGLRPPSSEQFLALLRDSDGPIPIQEDRNGTLLQDIRQVDRRVRRAIFQAIKDSRGEPAGWLGFYAVADEPPIGTQGLLFLSSIARIAALGLEKIAMLAGMQRAHAQLQDQLMACNSRLEMAQARVRALNRGMESRVSERTQALEGALRVLKEKSARVAHEARMRGMEQVAASFAHEIHSPVAGLTGHLEYMHDNLDELRAAIATGGPAGLESITDFEKVIEECRQAAERVTGVVASLRRFGEDTEEPGAFHLNAAVADAITLLEERMRACAELDLRLGALPNLQGDAIEMRHVVLALLTNAVEAVEQSGERGKITIASFADSARVTLLVRDSGVGIPPEVLANIFEPFTSTKEGAPGAGLGLHCAHQSVRRHGGTLRVRSAPGEGTKVTLELPLAVAESTEPVDAAGGVEG